MAIYGIFGLPRSGKTTYLCKIAHKCIKNGEKVYTNFPCKGALKLDFSTLGKLDYHDCTILIDEISLLCDSRDWKTFGSDLRYFFSNHGHYCINIYYCSQWLTDCDVKIRRMTEELYYVEKWIFGLSKRYTVERDVKTTDSGEVTDSYRFRRPYFFYRPRYYKMFDSFSRRSLPPPSEEVWEDV